MPPTSSGSSGTSAPAAVGQAPARRVDESMTLITTMLQRPLDAGYQQAADRRVADGLPASTGSRSVIVLVVMVVTGFMFAVAALAVADRGVVASGVRAELVSRIESENAKVAGLETQITGAAAQVRDLEGLELDQAGVPDLTDRIATLEASAGVLAMRGPGITVSLDDAVASGSDADSGARPNGQGFGTGRVTSADLQIVVNGLWGAGAEAIAVNGHRLTSQGTIRFAGQAIIVNFRPLTRPYVIVALGDAEELQARFATSFSGIYLEQLAKQFGIQTGIAASAELTVPGEAGGRADVATPIPTPTSANPTGQP